MNAKNPKQQSQAAAHQHAPMVATMSSTPNCPTKLLLSAVLLVVGFALGIVVTLSLTNSSPLLPGGTLKFFIPSTQNFSSQPTPSSSPSLSPPPTQLSPQTPRLPPSQVMDNDEEGTTIITDDISDQELMARASTAPRRRKDGAAAVPPKVAFLFLTKWDMPMAPLWEKFFEGHRGLYSVYVHTDPSFNASVPEEGSVFYKRRIHSKEVKWGQVSMVEAERRLLAHALLDHSNDRFILLSESHVPLFNFQTVYSYIINSTKVFLEAYDETGATGRGRYKKSMSPVVRIEQWRKGSQWFEVDRSVAVDIVSDDTYFPVFKRFCRRNCYADEHYLPTLLNIKYPSASANRSVTWVDWSRGGPHPARFTRMEVTVDFLRWLRSGRTCTYNDRTTNVCFLFARKFLPNSLTRLLRFAPKVMGFG